MKTKLLPLIVASMLCFEANAQKYVGGDISLLPEYENAKATYLDNSGKTIASPLTFFKEQGLNAMRVRLFVNPDQYTGSDKDPNACQDLDYVLALSKRIKDAGFNLLLDFHYSDTWADPAKQWTPAEWANLTDNELYQKIYDYTKDVLTKMVEAGATPDLIQPGNEISYGMLWGAYGTATSSLKKCYSGSEANWTRFTTLLSKAISACREVCPNAKIILHTERAQQTNVLSNFYEHMKSVDYDVIGLSYYPYFHGALNVLENAISKVNTDFSDKEIMIIETGYPYAWAVNGTTYDYTATYPYSDAGQKNFTDDMIKMLNKYKNVTGLFWWWMEYNAKGTSLSGWYNAPLFDSRTGRATSALSSLKDFDPDNTGVNDITFDYNTSKATDSRWFNLQGQEVNQPLKPGLYINNGHKVLVK
jgi:arabinogalactan endo-1,4-beta-galactosidase